MTTTGMTAKELLARLERHYIKPGDDMPGGMFMPEVALNGRRADALYVGFFASRGKRLVGHEIKVARSDWLHELDQPAKAEEWEQHCHSWYVVAPSTEIVRPEELPEGWGLLLPGKSRTRLDVKVKAAVHDERNPSWEATHALVQKADSLRMSATNEARRRAAEKAYADLNERVEREIARRTGTDHLQARIDTLQGLVDQLSTSLGLTIRAGDTAWSETEVTAQFVGDSFKRWLAVDRASDEFLRGYQIRSIRNAREHLQEAEKAIELLKIA
ncbi:hypothetical protein [Humibacter ginsenosidimutans]|uniref:MmcB family DNA repair protein n=1 Tax=Humibacter ginsenosidimutans TaxID=2599293 RepID=A0A5B8M813_9MICO|nr:hypothetical protein [Humibacter ginsenosidimutans]QDZ15805.1 hypothetical protein FPZ11_14450 [Humibacter ginsenosidimutans]